MYNIALHITLIVLHYLYLEFILVFLTMIIFLIMIHNAGLKLFEGRGNTLECDLFTWHDLRAVLLLYFLLVCALGCRATTSAGQHGLPWNWDNDEGDIFNYTGSYNTKKQASRRLTSNTTCVVYWVTGWQGTIWGSVTRGTGNRPSVPVGGIEIKDPTLLVSYGVCHNCKVGLLHAKPCLKL